MEVAECILLLPQLFLHLLFIYTNLPYLLSLNQSSSCFLQPVPSISSSFDFVYVTHPLHVPLSLSKHLHQVVSKHDHITSPHSPFPAYLLVPPILTCLSTPLYSCFPSTLHRLSRSP